MLNLLTNDAGRIEVLCHDIHYLWIGPMQIVLVTYIMYKEINFAALIGVTTLFLFLGIVGKFQKLFNFTCQK